MRLILFIASLSLFVQAQGQKEITNYLYTLSSISGGAEDSGTSATHTFEFVIRKEVSFPSITLDGKVLELKKGDTLILNLSQFFPYHKQEDTDVLNLYPAKMTTIFSANLYHGKYYLNIQEHPNWEAVTTYVFKQDTLKVALKAEPDSTWHYSAP